MRQSESEINLANGSLSRAEAQRFCGCEPE